MFGHRSVRVQRLRTVLQGEVERTGGLDTRAAHVGNGPAVAGVQRQGSVGIAAEALRPVVEARGRGRVDEFQGLRAVGRSGFLVQIEPHIRDAGLPAELQQQGGIIERPGRGVNHVTANAAVLTRGIRLLAEFDEITEPEQTLPPFTGNPRRIDAPAGRVIGTGARKPIVRIATGRDSRRSARRPARILDGRARAVAVAAIHGPRNSQGRGHIGRGRFGRVRYPVRDRRLPTPGGTWSRVHGIAVHGTPRVIDDVHPGGLIARRVGFDDQPVQERKHLVESRVARQIGVVEETDAPVAITDVGRRER